MSQWESTGWDWELENVDAINNTAVPFEIGYGDFEIPEEIDPRRKVRHDKQFNMGSCQGFSLTNCGEYLWNIAIGAKEFSNDRQFSPLFAYLETQRLDGLLGRDVGSTINGGIRIAKQVGFLEENELPYRTPYPQNARTLITQTMRESAGAFKLRSHSVMRSYDDCFRYVASGVGSLHTGTLWNNSFYAANGVLNSVSLNSGGGHATAWFGFSKRKDNRGRNYLWRLNSHNDSYTEIAPGVIDALFRHKHTVIVGVSDLETPEPRKLSLAEWQEGLRT
jgi:hypothetical protein